MVSNECMVMANYLLSIDLPKLARRFKECEVLEGKVSPPIYIRLDGVRFGRVLKGFLTPRDYRVHRALVNAAKEVIKWFNADLAYVASDELNILITKPLPYGERVFKLVSVSASIASANASLYLGKRLYFDSRVVKVGRDEVIDYLLYRARVCFNNFISSIYHLRLSRSKEVTPPTEEMFKEVIKSGLLIGRDDWEVLGTLIKWVEVSKEGINPLTNRRVKVIRRVLKELYLHDFLSLPLPKS